MSIGLLARILSSQGRLGSETLELYERALVIDIEYYGSEAVHTAISTNHMGYFYHLRACDSQATETRKKHLLLSESNYKESLRIYAKIYGPDHPETLATSSQISIVSCELSETLMKH
jgi:hypothetical protein